VGGASGGNDNARDLSQVILYNAAHNLATITKVVNYLLGTIPP